MKRLLAALTVMTCAAVSVAQVPDPNLHIYLCLGQSNMEGNAQIEPVDRADVPERFITMAAVDYQNPPREMYGWYTAVPPLVRENTGLTPVDYFGRTMVDNLPEDVRVGVIVVAVGGCKIEHLDKDYNPEQLKEEADWFRNFMSSYDNRPYDRLVACAREAQKSGVIKGILLHQGCSNTGDQQWPTKVNKVYQDLLADLDLKAEDVPLLAGEVVTSEMGGVCGSMNAIIDRLPETIPTAHVVSAAGCPQKGDGLHFTPHGYRVLGTRYATEMLKCEGIDDPVINYSEQEAYIPSPVISEDDFVLSLDAFNPSVTGNGTYDAETHVFTPGQWCQGGWTFAEPLDLSGYHYLVVELENPSSAMLMIKDSTEERGPAYVGQFAGKRLIVPELAGMMKSTFGPGQNGQIESLDTSHIYSITLMSMAPQPICIKQVFATNNDPFAE